MVEKKGESIICKIILFYDIIKVMKGRKNGK